MMRKFLHSYLLLTTSGKAMVPKALKNKYQFCKQINFNTADECLGQNYWEPDKEGMCENTLQQEEARHDIIRNDLFYLSMCRRPDECRNLFQLVKY